MRTSTAVWAIAVWLISIGQSVGQDFREQPLPLMRTTESSDQDRGSAIPADSTSAGNARLGENELRTTASPASSRTYKRLTHRRWEDLPSPDLGDPSQSDVPVDAELSAPVPSTSDDLPTPRVANPYSYGEQSGSTQGGGWAGGHSAQPAYPQRRDGIGDFVPDNYTPGSSMLGCYSGMCGDNGCGGCSTDDCGHCCARMCSCGSCLHRTGGFAEYLHWQVRDIDMAFAVPQNGIGGAGTVPVGQVGVLDFDYESGYRLGFNLAIDCCTSFTTTYTSLESTVDGFVGIDAPNVIQPLVMFPGTFNAGFTAQQATASYVVDLRMVDFDFRSVWLSAPRHHVNWVAGGRYALLDQSFQATFPFALPDGTTRVDTNIDFEGGGIRLGLEGERSIATGMRWRVYGKALASVLAGEFNSSYRQTNQFNGVEAITNWSDSRIVPILESEIGLSWNSCSERVRVAAGYYFAAWSNVVTTPEYINAVQAGNYVDVGQDAEDNVAFDGLTLRLEVRL